jgi:hypothetical protein
MIGLIESGWVKSFHCFSYLSVCAMLISPIFSMLSISRCPRRASVAIDLCYTGRKAPVSMLNPLPWGSHTKCLETAPSIWVGLVFERHDCSHKYAQNIPGGPLKHKGKAFPVLAVIFDGGGECVYSSSQQSSWFGLL